jgi:hypothetical protein
MVAKTQNIQVRSGNRILIEFGGTEIGMLQDLRANDDYAPEPASGVGDIHVQEYVPTMARHTVTTSQAILYKESLRSAGASLENGDDALRGLVFDITVYDKNLPAGSNVGSASYIRKYIGCSFASGDLDIRKHAIVMTNATFNALDCKGVSV